MGDATVGRLDPERLHVLLRQAQSLAGVNKAQPPILQFTTRCWSRMNLSRRRRCAQGRSTIIEMLLRWDGSVASRKIGIGFLDGVHFYRARTAAL